MQMSTKEAQVRTEESLPVSEKVQIRSVMWKILGPKYIQGSKRIVTDPKERTKCPTLFDTDRNFPSGFFGDLGNIASGPQQCVGSRDNLCVYKTALCVFQFR